MGRVQIGGEKKVVKPRNVYAPVPVMVAGIAIIATRFLGLALLTWELGFNGLSVWINSNTYAWDSTLIVLLSLVIIGVEVRCGFAVLTGLNWGRWGYVGCQIVAVSYLLLTSRGAALPAIFHISGESSLAILHQILLQKVPDLLVMVLLFLPRRSKRFFQPRKQVS
ncbi:hypothetical protein A0E43_12090 [Pectobacterium cacticida]